MQDMLDKTIKAWEKAKLDNHLGYETHSGNNRNGYRE
jgi:hypothetical protein